MRAGFALGRKALGLTQMQRVRYKVRPSQNEEAGLPRRAGIGRTRRSPSMHTAARCTKREITIA